MKVINKQNAGKHLFASIHRSRLNFNRTTMIKNQKSIKFENNRYE